MHGTEERGAGDDTLEMFAFLALTFALSWTPWVVLIVRDVALDAIMGDPMLAVAGFGPALAPTLAAAVLWVVAPSQVPFLRTRRSLVHLMMGERGKVGWDVVGAGMAVPFLSGVAGRLLASFFVEPSPLHMADSAVPALIIPWVAAFGEEGGWRGVLLPGLVGERGAPTLWDAVRVGLVWSLWHVPPWALGTMRSGDAVAMALTMFSSTLTLVAVAIVMARQWHLANRAMVVPLLIHWATTASAILLLPDTVTHATEATLSGLFGGATCMALALGLWFRS